MKNKEKNYEKLMMEVIPFEVEDVIRASNAGEVDHDNDTDAIGKFLEDI